MPPRRRQDSLRLTRDSISAKRLQPLPVYSLFSSSILQCAINAPKIWLAELLAIGPEPMFERAKAKGLVVPLPHYKIYVYGASTAGLTPRSWGTIRRFWELYFAAAGAELVVYSTECEVER